MPRPSTPVSPSGDLRPGAGCLRLFFLPFLAAGCFFFYHLALNPLLNIRRARDWQEVPCRILSSDVHTKRGIDGDTHKILIRYTYQVDGQAFESDRYNFNSMSSSGYSVKWEVVNRYSGGEATCYVNPAHPEEAVIQRGVSSGLWWGLFPLPFIAVGLLAFAPARFFANATSRTGLIRNTGVSKVRDQGATSVHLHDILSGPTELKASGSPLGKLLGVIAVALFWNGIVSVFLWKIWEGFSRNHPEWFPTIFLIPFVLVGLGLIVGVGYAFLNLFNPRISLLVSSPAVPLGGDVDVQWTFRGNSRRIRSLKIILEGAERATYRRGTDTVTDRHVFTEIPVTETSDPVALSAGSERITIPGHLMHTFKAPNNEIAWTLKVKGNIPRFPDVSEEFPLIVLPHAQLPS